MDFEDTETGKEYGGTVLYNKCVSHGFGLDGSKAGNERCSLRELLGLCVLVSGGRRRR